MLPVIAIVGRPNVGKSTLFNRLIRKRAALVGAMPGLTRDRIYGEGEIGGKRFIVIDTGGLNVNLKVLKEEKKKPSSTNIPIANSFSGFSTNRSEQFGFMRGGEESSVRSVLNIHDSHERRCQQSRKLKCEGYIELLMARQTLQAVIEADSILFLVDARSGRLPGDDAIARMLRQYDKTVHLVANKIDGLNSETALAEFYALGFGNPYPISAEHGVGIDNLIAQALENIPQKTHEMIGELAPEHKTLSTRIAFIGRPNAGKSTLINRILAEERVIVSEIPGTTRDSIFVNFARRGKNYVLIDTAGVRRRSKGKAKIEKFSLVRTLQAIEAAHVAVLMIDAKENIVDQDLWLIGFTIENGKALVIAINKWDNLPRDKRAVIRKELNRRLAFADFAKIHFISALHGSGVGNLFASINQSFKSASRDLNTSELTRILKEAVTKHAPPIVRGRRIKLRYAHAGGRNPPLIIIHGNQVQSITKAYRYYLANYFRKALRLFGTPVRIEFKSGKNPFDKR